ncbi:MAG: acylphosphatase [Actinomycetota bacterium]|nr:acylphosphatase [Actinomycetota bacterium]
MRRARVKVSGQVQGVFYRATCAERACELGLGGWIRNTGDGGVEAVFEGAPEAVDAAIGWCRQGPRSARVDSIEVVEEVPSGEQGFRVTA